MEDNKKTHYVALAPCKCHAVEDSSLFPSPLPVKGVARSGGFSFQGQTAQGVIFYLAFPLLEHH